MVPPEVDSVERALSTLDVLFHLHHRVDGQVMFDPATGKMLEGIGHYSFQSDGNRRAFMICNNPYPSDFDRGIITGLARKLKPAAQVTQDETQPSRKRGDDSCTYVVTW